MSAPIPNLKKPITGIVSFVNADEQAASLSNLGLFGGANTALTNAQPTTLDWSTGNVFSVTINSGSVPAMTVVFSNVSNKTVTLFIFIVGTPTIAWPGGIKWPGGAAPSVPATTKTGWYRFTQAGTTIYGEPVSLTLA